MKLARIPDASVDAIVTDPPYGLGFMGVKWDTYAEEKGRGPTGRHVFDHVGGNHNPSNPQDQARTRRIEDHRFQAWCETWAAECLRILKPGGHLLAFGGSRTWHRLAAGIEDAGFEIRDSIAWLYGSGFPKSMDVSKAIDKLDASDERMRRAFAFTKWVRSTGLTAKRIDEITGTTMGNHYTTHPTQPHIATAELFDLLRPHLPEVPAEIEALVAERTVESQNYAARAVIGERATGRGTGSGSVSVITDNPENRNVTAAHTDAAREWEGWGTALKPAFEPGVVARKPLGEKTIAANVLAHGTGALNIDATRVAAESGTIASVKGTKRSAGIMGESAPREVASVPHDAGRWPANVVLDESQAAALDAQAGPTKSTRGINPANGRSGGIMGAKAPRADAGEPIGYDDAGGVSRFFYVAKAPKSERPIVDGTAHPTVKPLALMRWLCRLVTPPGGCVVDPFAGSGTTLEAAYLEGFESIGVEMTPEYWPLIAARIERVTK